MLDNANYTPRLKKAYAETIRPAMKEEFSYKNDMMIPRLDKIVLNIGCGREAVKDSKKAKSAQADLTQISLKLEDLLRKHWVLIQTLLKQYV